MLIPSLPHPRMLTLFLCASDPMLLVVLIVTVVVVVVVDFSTFFGTWAYNYSVGTRTRTSRLEPLLFFD